MDLCLGQSPTSSKLNQLVSAEGFSRAANPLVRIQGRGKDGDLWRSSDRCCTPYAESYGRTMTEQRLLVSVVDDDASVRESLPDLLRAFGFTAHVFSSAEEFLESGYVNQTRCLILDVAMPGMTGPELQQKLKIRAKEIPIIFITAHEDHMIRPRLLEQGAVECLFKPFSHTALREALNAALRRK